MTTMISRFATPALVLGSLLVLAGVASGLASQAGLLGEFAEVARLGGLAATLVGGFFVGFYGLVVRVSASGEATSSWWSLAPVIGFAFGVLFGNAFFGQSFPASGIGLMAGVVFWWAARRRERTA